MATRVETASLDGQARLGTVRRFYFYLVALVSFVAGLIAFSRLVEQLADAWLQGAALYTISGPAFVRNTVAATASILAVATPIFLIHWHSIQRRNGDPEERAAALRKFYLAAASAFSLGYALVCADHFLSGVAALALGRPPVLSTILPSAWLSDLVIATAAAALLYYWQATARADGDFGSERGVAGTWRRLFLAGVMLTGLTLIAIGSADLASATLRRLVEQVHPAVTGTWFALEMGDGISLLLLGLVTTRITWMTWQSICAREPGENGATVRYLFLYVAVLGGAVATLVPAAVLVRRLLLWLFAGFDTPLLEIVDSSAVVLGFIPAGIWIWSRHWRLLRSAEAQPASAEAVSLRRIYYYAVSATGLVLMWLGLVGVVQVILDLLLTNEQIKAAAVWENPLATGLSLLIVGAPVWALHWRAVQRVARQRTAEGAAERASLPRRIYLYGVSFAGAVLILYSFAQVFYRLLLYALGDHTLGLFSPELAEDLARSLIAALLWIVHFAALRTDAALGMQRSERLSERRDRLEKRISGLEADLARAREELAQLVEEGDG